jgi:phytoene dehydrogenase-like protein
MIGGRQNLIIHVIPVPSQKWIKLKEENYKKYNEEKQQIADFYIKKVEQYMIPQLQEHIVYMDISTPATYKDYIGSPTASLYDMLPLPTNFGKNRLPTRTPVKNLFVPKFSHGIWPCFQAGLQVVDMISEGKIMKGNSSLSFKK